MPEYLTAQVIGLFLVFARVGGVVMLMPGVGEEGVNPRMRLLFALLVALVIFPVVGLTMPPMPRTLPAMGAALGHELIIGLILGTVSRILFSALQVAGTLIAQQTGLAVAMTFDPTQGGQTALVARFLVLLAVLLVFATNSHHMLLSGVVRSYAVFPISGGLSIGDFSALITDMVEQSFLLGIQLSAPLLVLGVVFNLAVGLMARLSPMVPVFFIAQPLNVLLGLALFASVIGSTMLVFMDRYRAGMTAILGG